VMRVISEALNVEFGMRLSAIGCGVWM
jgi:hypothetical protein